MEIPFKISHDLAGLSQPFSLLIIQNLLILIEKKWETLHSFICSLRNWFNSPYDFSRRDSIRGKSRRTETEQRLRLVNCRYPSSTEEEGEEEESMRWHSGVNVVLRNTLLQGFDFRWGVPKHGGDWLFTFRAQLVHLEEATIAFGTLEKWCFM